jgi:deoxyribonuclease IV
MIDNIGYSINIPSGTLLTNKITKNTDVFNSIQVMFDSQNISEKDLQNAQNSISHFKYKFVHSTYKINIGSDFLIDNKDVFYNTSFELLLKEIKYSYLIGADGIILHMGKNVQKRYDNDVIYNNMIFFVLQLFSSKVVKKDFLIIFETSAGQRGELCYELIDFINFIKSFENHNFYNNIGVCIDTCHIFQAGYDLNKIKVINKIHELFSQIEDKIKLIHLNDSYHDVGKRIDKHQNIGEGFIDTKKLKQFIVEYKDVPMILETPNIFSSVENLMHNN